jgi:hypothetical protein
MSRSAASSHGKPQRSRYASCVCATLPNWRRAAAGGKCVHSGRAQLGLEQGEVVVEFVLKILLQAAEAEESGEAQTLRIAVYS